MLKTINCLNCGTEVSQNFCPNCGQKTSTHRYSILHYIQNDFVNAVTDINRGFLFTAKQLLTNPGKNIRAYILGKRINYINSVTFILLIIGLDYYLMGFSHVKIADLVSENSKNLINEFAEFAKKNPKLSSFLLIPFTSFFSYLWFRKSKFNFTEHFILNTYITAGTYLFSTLFTVISIIYTNVEGLKMILLILQIVISVYTIWAYYGFFKPDNYKKLGLIVRSILVLISVQFIFVIIGFLYGYFFGAFPKH